ncbi:hypothetical protein F0562_021580 [Nyssa sinensis]|uniref:Uncharacterized protein n=1 Tax=Nyssa sinensis TaxID=561372 RepID=A0A5J5BLY8_9ASTE|nr:hypothetical protein F0562_021580 [Nyssa sinensis]
MPKHQVEIGVNGDDGTECDDDHGDDDEEDDEAELTWKEGGGVRGGSGVSRNLTLGVPGKVSHMNGIATDAPP